MNEETTCMVSGRVGRIWKYLLPPAEEEWTEPDVSEEVFSGPRNPRFGNSATGFEHVSFIL